MKISLSPEIERLIAERVSSGRYRSADEVVREGLELLEAREKETRLPQGNGTTDFGFALKNIAEEVPSADWERVPADLSKKLDYYLYGERKSS